MKDVPKKFVIGGETFYIREKIPLGYALDEKPFAEGGHNKAYRASYRGSAKKYLFRLNTDEFHSDLKFELASEITYNIRFAHHGIAPKLYDYGYCPSMNGQRGFYWQVLEMFDDSLYGYLKKASKAECQRTQNSIERQLVNKFAKMAELKTFCYDIHPRNVVLRKTKGGKMEIALIDFDDTFCIGPSRIYTELRKKLHTKKTQKPNLPSYSITPNNLLFALLLVFSSNTQRKCGVLYFRKRLKTMLRGSKTHLVKGGGAVSLSKVVAFLSTSSGQDRSSSTLSVMRWWNPMNNEKATAAHFAAFVLGGK